MPTSRPLDRFHERLALLIERSGGSASAFARAAGIDRSTLSQLLDEKATRLPRAETLVAIASHARVSVDWLLGLSDSDRIGAAIIESVLQVAPTRAPGDDRFVDWLREAAGFRVKTVPSTFPDFLKTPDVLRFEYQAAMTVEPDRAVRIAAERLAVCREPDTEIEAAFALQNLEVFAEAAGPWRGLPLPVRRAALTHLRDLVRQLYPGLRLYLYDQRQTIAVPFSVFGTKRAAIYIGGRYLVFTAIEHVRIFSDRFDELIRAAAVLPHAVDAHISALVDKLERARV
jgi:transcriptional regulator with XRE-family HTH domain